MKLLAVAMLRDNVCPRTWTILSKDVAEMAGHSLQTHEEFYTTAMKNASEVRYQKFHEVIGDTAVVEQDYAIPRAQFQHL